MADETKPRGIEYVTGKFPDAVLETGEFHGQHWVTVEPAAIHDVVAGLKAEAGYDMLEDLTAVDYLDHPLKDGRFRVVYHLLSTAEKTICRVKVKVADEDVAVPTVTDLFPGADWLEREVYDMFGIRFEGHPDLRRILMAEDWEGFPCRRDYPVQGHIPIHDPMREQDFRRETAGEQKG